MKISNTLAIASASLLAQAGAVLAQANVCNSGIYGDLAPLSGLAIIQQYCTANYPRAPTTSTTTVTTTKLGVSTSTVTSTTTATNLMTQTAYATETDTASVPSTTTVVSTSVIPTTTTITNTQTVTTTVAYGAANAAKRAASSSAAASSAAPASSSASSTSTPTSKSSSAASSTTLKTSSTQSSTASQKSGSAITTASSTDPAVSAAARASKTSSQTTSTTSSAGNILASLVNQAKNVISTYCSCIEAPKSTVITVTSTVSSTSVALVTVTATVSVTSTQTNTLPTTVTQTQTYPVTITQTSTSTSTTTVTTSTTTTTTSQCPQASPAYSSSLGCVNTISDKNNCGAIGNVCPASKYACSQGVCSAPNLCTVGQAGCKPGVPDCGCYRTAEGTGYCQHQTETSFGPRCTSSSDCANGLACLTDLNGAPTLPGYCATPDSLGCANTAASRMFSRSLMGRIAQQEKRNQSPAGNLRKKAIIEAE